MPFEDLYQSLRTDFVQKVRSAVEKLEAWEEGELFYRRCYELRYDKKALLSLFNTLDPRFIFDPLDPCFIKEKYVLTPKFLEQNKNGFSLKEAMFLTPDMMSRNVFLRKHWRYIPGYNHKSDFFEILYVLRGQCTNTVAGKRMLLPAGSLCFIAPETYHSTEAFDDDSLVVYLIIRRTTFDEVFVNLLTTSDILSIFFMRNIYKKISGFLVFNIANDTELMEQFLSMLVEENVNDDKSGRIMEGQFLIFFSMLMRKYRNSPIAYEQVGVKQEHWELIAHINKHFRTLTQAELAAQFNLSAAYCSRIIKSITGKNFTTLVHDLRMTQARSMLRQSDVKMCDISFSLGYENHETFIRNFKKAHGISPFRYRMNNPGIN